MLNSLQHLRFLALAVLTASSFPALPQQLDTAVIKDGSRVSIEYTLSLTDGSVVQSNVGAEAMTYTQGEQQILPALENTLAGMRAGEEKKFTLSAVEAYGEVRDDAFREVPLDSIPQDARRVGALLRTPGYKGSIQVHELREEVAVLDFNHPLAGEEITFAIRVISVE